MPCLWIAFYHGGIPFTFFVKTIVNANQINSRKNLLNTSNKIDSNSKKKKNKKKKKDKKRKKS